MGIDAQGLDGIVRIRREAENVLNDQSFQRSPTLSRLLAYLVDMTAEGKGKSVKSYTIAMDGLGKSVDSAEDIDTYARVVVTRLRKALDAYYSAGTHGERLQIPSGSYEVILENMAPEYEEPGPALADPPSAQRTGTPADGGGKRRYASIAGWVLALMLGLGIAMAIGMHKSRSVAERWARDNFPTLKVLVENEGGNAPEEVRLVEAQRHALHVALNRYLGFRILDGKEANADFAVRIFAFHENTGLLETFSLVETKTDRVIWSARHPLDSSNVEENAQSVAFDLASISGALNAHLRRRGYDVWTSDGCWLRFTESAQTYNTFGDAKLQKCAAKFHANREPATRISTMLYGCVRRQRQWHRFEVVN